MQYLFFFFFFKKISQTSRITKNELLKHLNQPVKVYSEALKKYKCFQEISKSVKFGLMVFVLYVP